MTNLEIALKLREQIKVEWPYVFTILAFYKNNKDGIFTERIQSMIDKLLPIIVVRLTAETQHFVEIKSLPNNTILIGSENNPLEILK